MLLNKRQRRSQVRQISAVTAYKFRIQAHSYRLKQYAKLIRLGISETLADRAFQIWENGCKDEADELALSRVEASLNKNESSPATTHYPTRVAA